MLERIWKMQKDEDGFTLIELMVVVLIIAILIAIAIPTFLGLRQRAQDRSAQSDLRNGLTAAKAHYTDGESYTGFTEAVAEAIEPSLSFTVGAGSTTVVGISGASGNTVYLSKQSASDTWFCLGELNGVTVRGSSTVSEAANLTDCAANGGW